MEDEGGGENSFCFFLLATQRQILYSVTRVTPSLKWENFGKTKFIPKRRQSVSRRPARISMATT
jgi:hypothetical protein